MLKKRIEIHEVGTITVEINHITQNFNQGTNYSSAIYIEEAFYLDSFNNIRKVFIRVERENSLLNKK